MLISAEAIDAVDFRRVLGHYPSGVVAVTARSDDLGLAGMVVSSFTSVSLDPPLVAFLPAKTSSTWPVVEAAGAFCANVLAADQEDVCRQLATKGGDKFAGLDWRPAATGAPVLDGVVAWVDCTIEDVHDAGDHWIVVGRVVDLAVEETGVPLLFFQGGYGRFAPRSVSAVATPDLVEQLRLVDLLRGGMAASSERLGVEVLATARLDQELMVVASSGHPGGRLPTRIGQRMPYVAPLGVLFAAHGDPREWLGYGDLDPAERERLGRVVDRVRERGWSATLRQHRTHELERALASMDVHDPTPGQRRAVEEALDPLGSEVELEDVEQLDHDVDQPITTVSVPVSVGAGSPQLQLTAYGLPETSTLTRLTTIRDELLELAATIHP